VGLQFLGGLVNKLFLTKSTMEADLVALESGTIKADWLKELLMDLPIVAKLVLAILLHCDN
jgi:hypothetical protein